MQEHHEASAEYGVRAKRFWAVRFEVAAVVLFVFLSVIVSHVLYGASPSAWLPGDWKANLYVLAIDVPLVMLLLFIIWGSGDELADFGIRKPEWNDVPKGAVVFAVLLGVAILQEVASKSWPILGVTTFPGSDYVSPHTPIDWVLFVPLTVINCAYQELLCRGYMIPRFSEVFNGPTAGLILSSLLFGAWHLYQGPSGVIGCTVMGFVFGYAFMRWRSLWPLTIAHATYNLAIGIIWPLIYSETTK